MKQTMHKPGNRGMVYLVGAGPGAEELITVKGLQCLEKANVVLYDRLSGASLVKAVPEKAEFIDVGKQPDHHPVPQEEINRLLVEKAQAGNLVVRLKGGDPFVFGRGGEEALALQEAGIPFEIVPGISSSIAVPAYAGIPVTHRHLSASFHVITGHEDPKKGGDSIDYEALARITGTLIFLMGVGQLPRITQQLMLHGKNPQTPAALVYRGTTPQQKTVTGTLETIVERVTEEGLKPPCVIVIGEVVALQPALSWVEKKPLFGQRVLVTRSRQQASKLSQQLRTLGAEVMEIPTIVIEPRTNQQPVYDMLEKLETFQHFIFTSVNGVQVFMESLHRAGKDLRWIPATAAITAVGKATAEALEAKGLRVTHMPEVFTGEGILKALTPLIAKGERVVIPRAEIGRPQLVEGLEALGAVVTDVPLYETVIPEADGALLEEMVKNPPHWTTFTSGSTVHNLMQILKEAGHDFPADTKIAVIGPVTAAAVREYGLTITAEANPHTINDMVEAMVMETIKDRSGNHG